MHEDEEAEQKTMVVVVMMRAGAVLVMKVAMRRWRKAMNYNMD